VLQMGLRQLIAECSYLQGWREPPSIPRVYRAHLNGYQTFQALRVCRDGLNASGLDRMGI
jgi:hypothetical protein